MAISDVPVFAHLSDADIDALAVELDAIRTEIEDSRGQRDARYIYRTIAAQRALEVAGRVILAAGRRRAAWWAGALTLGVAKIIENMEIGHNVMHGQWDWMNDPEIHSTSWEWDMAGTAAHWRFTHNVRHHKYTNVVGMDTDVGYGFLRVTPDQRWRPHHIANLLFNTLLTLGFEWGVAWQHTGLQIRALCRGGAGGTDRAAAKTQLRQRLSKAANQLVKDYLAIPALTSLSPGASVTSTATANLAANLIRNIWIYAVVMCGHFPDGAQKFSPHVLDHETKGQWYLRQILGSANIDAGPLLAFLTGNLSYQIEHHLYPDLPSNRLAQIAVRVRQVCDKYDLPYTSGPFLTQYATAWRTIAKLSLPNQFLTQRRGSTPWSGDG
ncbi:NADPH-dependent stearoyl-CoA 9-desaturase [Mycobacterium lacus]|uniref:NADPH-dependent stearoyl-CoA 9-desaturase n=1 Tax=Mycobacterium lacus TaxID=169765 RepID=A0A7I7NFR1_9MYCO|nr:fatty acid desaturase [Mycobacterium lacus]BBX95374.1 NADPH-dependent stearoyl-CoA 9-desaturase [Mycobacterium lacus]